MRIVDLFAGCGGLSKGFQDAGFQIVAAFEFWNKAAECYALNFSHPVFTTDLSNIEEAVGKRVEGPRAVALYGEYLCATAYDRAEASPRYGSHCS
ncbi:MAG: DNA cytosine methyltransferase [Selenomonas sp.]|jgi:Site-specific DNA methylase|nr:DNA cytosine methyltransferase [uncultured Selenomonas sp.]